MQTRVAVSFVVALLWGAACGDGNSDSFVASGIIEGTAIKVSAQTGGLILHMPVEEGEEIQLEQTIAVIDTEKLALQLEQVQAALEELEVQAQISRNTLTNARANLENIEKKYQRFQDLYQKNSASQQTLDDLKMAYDAARTQWQNARQTLQVLESKEKGLRAQRKLVRRQIEDAIVTAPISGTLTTRFYEPGETVAPGLPIVELIDLGKMWTKIFVSEMLLPKIEIGGQAVIRIDGTERTLSGRVSWISPKAEFTPRSILTKENRTSLVYAVKVTVDNPSQLFKHGMPVEVILKN
ncbi:MAG: HlyD family secretion protein [bacterium]